MQGFCAAGGTIDEFYNSTFDEVLLVIKGRVDAWRIDRIRTRMMISAWVKDTQQPAELYSLPYDDELKTQPQDLSEWYAAASKDLATFNWPSKN